MGLLKNLKIGQRLALGFGLIIVLIGILGYEAINNLKLLSGLTNKLHKHPLTVSNATLEISGDIVRIHRSMKDVALAKNEEQLVKAWNTANSYEKPVYDNFALVNERFLGDKTNVNEAKQAFADWKAIREEVYQFMQSGERDKAAAITKGKGAKHVADMNNKIDYLVNFAKNKADEFLGKAQATRNNSLSLMYGLLTALIVAALIIAYLNTISITRPLGEVTLKIVKIAEGVLKQDKIVVKSTDETGSLGNAFITCGTGWQNSSNTPRESWEAKSTNRISVLTGISNCPWTKC